MSSRPTVKRKLRNAVLPAIAACLVVYFLYHLVQGDRGLLAQHRLTDRVAEAETTLDELEARREALEQRVALLGKDRIDRDALDEQARRMLNYGHPLDLVLIVDDDVVDHDEP